MRNLKRVLCLGLLMFALTLGAQSNKSFRTKAPNPTKSKAVRHLLESLIGEGIVLKNFSVTRTPVKDAFGFFEDDQARLGMKKGLLMATGSISGITACNTSSGYSEKREQARVSGENGFKEDIYPELAKLLKEGFRTYHACVLELDVVPTADTLSFNYVFGSDEYDEYVGTMFNDVFGFFISGKGIDGDLNLAVVPGTDIPVSVNTINGGNGLVKASNATYFVSNTYGNIAIEYDGLTRLMQICQPVTPYESYHLKIAIADVSDGAFDSGVFIEGKSFISYDKSYNVLFDHNSTAVDDGYKTMLKNIASTFEKTPALERGKILVTGHTDADGSQEYNDVLSARRAEEVVDLLKRYGVDEDKMVVISKGENMPRADNFTDSGKHFNRRVEIKMCGALNKYEQIKQEEFKSIKTELSALNDNFPNPFSNSAIIRAFVKPEAKEAYLSVTDMNGNVVRTVHLLERGKTETYFGSENLPSGIYMATLIVDEKNAGTIKLVIQK